jgi:bifunctional non-homologous end joining protein LigD
MASDKPGRELRSLLLGYYEGDKLIFAGKAGTGFGLANPGAVYVS